MSKTSKRVVVYRVGKGWAFAYQKRAGGGPWANVQLRGDGPGFRKHKWGKDEAIKRAKVYGSLVGAEVRMGRRPIDLSGWAA